MANPVWWQLLLVHPVLEELFFRGWVLQRMRSRWPNDWAVVACAALFAVVHTPFWAHPVLLLPIFALGLACSGLVVKFNNWGVLGAMVLHGVFNAVTIGTL